MSIPLHEVKSSQIHAIGYSAETETLAVQFFNKGKPGAVYEYAKVSPVVYKAFDASDSKGKYFGVWIKGKYEYKRIAEPPAPEPEAA